ncbi:hypothetical protein TRFO_30863 [Tritrichomonas foetus]|uniref:RRM domain-containing protein n=1 Tax=Tritrichomonas foetus TaxID=1144522 RepID=A0A1J4JX95_9EUKA|nr:hypothetical protein TRFO_30863 [Tritrichomonas foetus]|eukprot:OHT02156.1 hypothetical protein TRFO_30863 [Tritrichomonas foetus]
MSRRSLSARDRTVFVGGLNFETNEDSIYAFFREIGNIEKIHIFRRVEGQSKGFGYVTFKDMEYAKLALKFDGAILDNHKIRIDNYSTCIGIIDLKFPSDDELLKNDKGKNHDVTPEYRSQKKRKRKHKSHHKSKMKSHHKKKRTHYSSDSQSYSSDSDYYSPSSYSDYNNDYSDYNRGYSDYSDYSRDCSDYSDYSREYDRNYDSDTNYQKGVRKEDQNEYKNKNIKDNISPSFIPPLIAPPHPQQSKRFYPYSCKEDDKNYVKKKHWKRGRSKSK